MTYNKQYLMEKLSNPADYVEEVSRRGITEFPPCIISCAITGQNQGKESNPNLPEEIDEQVEQAYEAYKAGASLIHLHTRDKNNLALPGKDPQDYIELNERIREKCPDVIINNTLQGGSWKINSEPKGREMTSVVASPEVASIDITNYSAPMLRKKRPAPLSGRDEDIIQEMEYHLSSEEFYDTLEQMKKYGVKPEFEAFDLGDLQYLRKLINEKKMEVDHPY